jgi:hypothetical protein
MSRWGTCREEMAAAHKPLRRFSKRSASAIHEHAEQATIRLSEGKLQMFALVRLSSVNQSCWVASQVRTQWQHGVSIDTGASAWGPELTLSPSG